MATSTPQQAPAAAGKGLEHRQAPVECITDNLEKPSLDDRSYRVVRLPNQLEVLLVHDADTDKASAAMDVNVGNFSDPDDMPGMAHAVEHALFMGTKKYPVENAYSQYLSANSGSSNAYTAATSTNFYFEVAAKPAESANENEPSPLYGGLDRFAQFFIEPLFLASTLDRELHAVDSENKKNLQSDHWRLHQLNKSLSNPKHPYGHFSTGNLETLKTQPEARGVNVREEFIKFHDKHYSANRMKLVVLGRESLDTLEAWTAELFADVRNKHLPQNRWEDEQPMGKKEMLTQVFAKPVMDTRLLELTFPCLNEENLYESQPNHYLSHLIGHEGPGSIMAYIKARGWANGLSAGGFSMCPGSQGQFMCRIRLTPEGLKNYKEVVKVFFQYISLLNETPPQQWIFDEQKELSDVEFTFKQKTQASSFTSQTSSSMQQPMPREWLLSNAGGSGKLRKFDPEAITAGLAFLRPENLRLFIVSQTFPGDWNAKEKWYGTEYKYEGIPQDFVSEIRKAATSSPGDRASELHLPHKNQFIPSNFDVEKKDVKEPARAPKLIRRDDMFHSWFKKDDSFWVPKANLFINLTNPLPSVSAENAVKARVYGELVRDALEEYAYDAELAGLEYSVASYSDGIDIEISGYNDKLQVLLEKVLLTMRDLEVKEDRFAIVKERMLRGMRNWDYQQPYFQVGDFTRWLNNDRGFINDQLLEELSRLEADDIRTFYPQLLRQMHIENLMHGNLHKEDALRFTNVIESILKPRPLPQAQWPVLRALMIPPGANFTYERTLRDPENVNHCIEYLLSIGDKADRTLRAKTLLLDQMTHEPAFDQLRTKEQLGYVVFSGSRTTVTTIGYRFIVQSEKSPAYLESRIDAFLAQFAEVLRDMSEEDFESHKRSLVTKRLEKLKNLDQESSRLWTHIGGQYFDFELVWHDAAHIKALTKTDMVEFFANYIAPSSPTRAKLAIHLVAQARSKEATEEVQKASVKGNGTEPVAIKDVRAYKSKLAVTPAPQPVQDLSVFEDCEPKL